jgi:uncharacterized membrane protein
MAVMTIYPILSAERIIEPFSEIGVLGANGKLGDYPSQVTVGQKFSIFIYVGDHEGRSGYYRISAKLGDQNSSISDTIPLAITPVDYWDVFLMNEGNTTVPVTLSVDRAGLNQRFVFELSVFDPKTNVFIYKSWSQLWLNVTKI